MAAPIDYDALREEVRDFAMTRCPPEIRVVVAAYRKLSRKVWYPWQKILFAHGWGAPGWPKEYGGTGWDPKQRHIFDEVMAECDCPPQYHHGLRHLGSVIIEYGSEEQKRRFLPGILNGEDWWCQGCSEPGAGSDLASLRGGRATSMSWRARRPGPPTRMSRTGCTRWSAPRRRRRSSMASACCSFP